jgi:hypothetical protein
MMGVCEAENGDRFAYSRLTDTWYRVYDYEHVEGEKIIANGKKEIPREDVPAACLEATTERPLEADSA